MGGLRFRMREKYREVWANFVRFNHIASGMRESVNSFRCNFLFIVEPAANANL